MGNIDFDVASLAAGVAAGLRNNVEAGAFSNKDREVLNPNRLDIYKFLNKHPHQSHIPQPQPQYHNPQLNPGIHGHNNQGQGQYPPPSNVNIAPPTNGAFTPIPLPNSPLGVYPMDENVKKYLEAESGKVKPNTSEEFNVDVKTPSFQNTDFKPVESFKKLDKLSEDSIMDDLRRVVSEQTKEIEKLNKKVTTLSTRVFKLIKHIEENE